MKASGIIAGLVVILMGFWGYPTLKTVTDWGSTLLIALFPGMNSYTALAITWLPLVLLGIIIFVAISYFLGHERRNE